MQILLPAGAEAESGRLRWLKDVPSGRLFEAIEPGITRVQCPNTGWAVFVRVSRSQYVGLSHYRHFEAMGGDEEDYLNGV